MIAMFESQKPLYLSYRCFRLNPEYVLNKSTTIHHSKWLWIGIRTANTVKNLHGILRRQYGIEVKFKYEKIDKY